MFGVMAIVNIVITGLVMFSDLGIGPGVIQNEKNTSQKFLNTAWVMQIVRGVILWSVAGVISIGLVLASDTGFFAPGSVYLSEYLPEAIVLTSLSAIIQGFNSTKILVLSRQLVVGRLALIEVTSQFFALLVVILWASFRPEIWALVAGNLTSATVYMVLSHKALPGDKNSFSWDQDSFRSLFSFGKWIFVTSIVTFLATNYQQFALGYYFDASKLGVFSIALFLCTAVTTIGSKISHTVLFPGFSEINRLDPKALKGHYYKSRIYLHTCLFLLGGIVIIWSPTIVDVLYDVRYKEAGNILQILMFGTLILFYTLPSGSCLMATKKLNYSFYGNLLCFLTLLIGIPISWEYFGESAVIWLIALTPLCRLVIGMIGMYRQSILSWRMELLSICILCFGILIGVLSLNAFYYFNIIGYVS